MKKILFIAFISGLVMLSCQYKTTNKVGEVVSDEMMKNIYEEIKTPYKYGVVFKHPDPTKKVDSPTIFRKDDIWYMSYIIFDGQGYETWLAQSDNLLEWEMKGKIMSFTTGTWDGNQKAGYVSLVDIDWCGSYEPEQFEGKYWMSYLGGPTDGYESGILSVGMANSGDITKAKEWERMKNPILTPNDNDARWFENHTIYKSLIIHDKEKNTDYPFIMYYNAKGDTAAYESIGMAVSEDMVSWKRFGSEPIISRNLGTAICGDAQIAKIDDVYVLFYFGAFWQPGINSASEKFACSYDLMHWTEWQGEDLVFPSEDYDQNYAHKPWVIKWNNVVYHFYNAVGSEGRVIALATSIDLKSDLRK